MSDLRYTVSRCLFGALFVLLGLAQTDYVGKKMFPSLNKHIENEFEEHHVHSIPWSKFGLKVSADQFREVVGYTVLVSGLLLLVNSQVRCAAFVMAIVSTWGTYADILAGSPISYVIGSSVIALIMLSMAFPLSFATSTTNWIYVSAFYCL